MLTLIIRQLGEKTEARLRARAAVHGYSVEEEAREILRAALAGSVIPKEDLAESIRKRFAPFGGIEPPLPKCA